MKQLLKRVVFLFVLLSVLFSLFVLYTPKPSMAADQFSAIRALEHIEVISREPHSVFDPVEHEAVRLYLKDKLTDYLGATNVYEYNYSKETLGEDTSYDIKNLLGVIPGESDTGIMLVGHYDSRGHIGRYGELGRSYGAADDGYALGVMLEIANLYKDKPLKNTIYILFTDAEETGLYGARMMKTEPVMDHVGFLINIEARGISGAAYMFETSPNNDKVIDFYRKANLPVSYSLATAVYQVMPNYTDFTEFLDEDIQGINFAVLEGLEHYHTPLDNYEELSVSSIQHYGEQIEPLVGAFTSDAKYSDVNYFIGSQDQVFFTLFPNLFVAYKETTAQVFHLLALLFLGCLVYLGVRNQQIQFKKMPHYLKMFSIVLVIGIVLGLLFAQFLAFIAKTPYSVTYVRMSHSNVPTLLFFIGFIYVVYRYYDHKVKEKNQDLAFLLVGISLNLSIALLSGYLLSGASFLFFIPALFGLLSMLSSYYQVKPLKYAVYGLTILVNTLLIVPILYSFFLALTVGGLPILVLLLMINLGVYLPVYQLFRKAVL